MKDSYDIIIIGGGPAGLTAGLYSCRAGLETLLLEKFTPGGQAVLTDLIENYPGFPDGIQGPALLELMERQARKVGLEVITDEAVSIEPSSISGQRMIDIKTKSKSYTAGAAIVAVGASPRMLGVPGERQFHGRGVSYCATCDGPMYKGKDVVVVGGGNAAVEEALYLTKLVKHVSLVHRRDRLRAHDILAKRIMGHKNVTIHWNSLLEEIVGDKKVSGVRIKDLKTGRVELKKCEGVFIFVGTEPNTKFLSGALDMDEAGYIIVDKNLSSSFPGAFACGDCTSKELRQIVTACGEGALAAESARRYLEGTVIF